MTVFAALTLAILTSTPARAQEMAGRLGVGYNAEFSNLQAVNGAPAVSVKFGMSRIFATALVLGVSTLEPINTVAALKAFFNLVLRPNVNFYGFVGGGVISADRVVGGEGMGGMGAEFFIPGLESVGFSFEAGLAANNLSGAVALKTLGAGILNAGIHFYF